MNYHAEQEKVENDLTTAEVGDHYIWPGLLCARVFLQFVLERDDVNTVEHDNLED